MTPTIKSRLAFALALALLPAIAGSEDKKKPPADKDVAELLRDDVEVYLAARIRILARRPSCRELVAEQLRQIDPATDVRLRLRLAPLVEELANMEALEAEARRLEPVLRRRDDLEKDADPKGTKHFAALAARKSLHSNAYKYLCYFSFPRNMNGYETAVSLQYGNGGDNLDVVMYGGQKNTIRDLGTVDDAAVKSAPNAAETELWGTSLVAEKDHVYIEHCLDERESVNQTFKFKVVDMKPGEWILIEWESIPQDK
ncbi:MAG: hypothetical protein HYY18_00560 [Planctomycetes bacterium]|nr:hypothetical protein [Planctomycetota bacterium]